MPQRTQERGHTSTVVRSGRPAPRRSPGAGDGHPVLDLQRQVGNQAVTRLLGQAGSPAGGRNGAPAVKRPGSATAPPVTVQRAVGPDGVFSAGEFQDRLVPPKAKEGASTEYKEIIAALQESDIQFTYYRQALAAMRNQEGTYAQQLAGARSVLSRQGTLRPHLVKAHTNAVAYLDATSGVGGTLAMAGKRVKDAFGRAFGGKTSRVRVKNDKIERIGRLQTQIEELFPRLNDARDEANRVIAMAETVEERDTEEAGELEGQAKELAQMGRFGRGQGRILNDQLGTGQMGSVALVEYEGRRGRGEGPFKGVFKKEPDKVGQAGEDQISMGIQENRPHFALRAVAASHLNDLFGLKVIPETHLAFHDQLGFGQVMQFAPGTSPRTTAKTEVTDASPEKLEQIRQAIKGEVGNEGFYTKLTEKSVDDGRGGKATKYFLEEVVTHPVDWQNPVLQRELSTLQLFDALIAQTDRHAENYFIDTDPDTGEVRGVMGIDNDLVLAKYNTDPSVVSFMAGHQVGLPQSIDETVARKFLSISPEQVVTAVTGLLTEAEIKALVIRFTTIREKLQEKTQEGTYVINRIGGDEQEQWTNRTAPPNKKAAYWSKHSDWQLTTMQQEGRLLTKEQAEQFARERLEFFLSQVDTSQEEAKELVGI